ncbi:PP2C family protein-serine/threonine phosphatase [Streptomyces shaanxiensis]
MTEKTGIWKIASEAGAAGARAAVAGLVVAAGTPPVDRARFLTSLSARLRDRLDQGGTWELHLLTRRTTPDQECRLDVWLRPFDERGRRGPACEPTLSCPLPNPPARDGAPVDASPSHALLSADEDTAAVLHLLDEQERLVQLHRDELHQTNQGVLALHSDLEAAALAQRELLEAERSARAEVERARRLLNFLADASAAITSSLSPTEVLRRLTDLLVPDHAARLDVWLLDDEEEGDEESGPVPERSRAAVVAALTSLTVGALRNARRAGIGLADQACLADQAVFAQYGGKVYASTLLLEFHLATGTVRAVDAGSPQLFRQRGDHTERVELDAQLPLGMFEETPYDEQTFQVEPGDRLIVVSTGVHGARSAAGDLFGERALRQILGATRSTPTYETARAVVAGLVEHYGSRELMSDAAVICLDWQGRQG